MATKNKILWLCSWYPSEADRFNGDFIQRHARAVAAYCDIHVIHVLGDDSGRNRQIRHTVEKHGRLTEEVICFPRSHSFAGKLIAHFRWQRLFRNAVRKYIKANGTPDLVHVHIPMRAGLIALWIRRHYRIPFIVTEHWGIYNDTEQLNFSTRSRVFRQLTTRIFSSAAAVTSVSHFLGQGVNKLVAQVPYQVVPNVVDTSLFQYHHFFPSRFRFIHVSNMVPLKNVQGIINSFARLVKEGIDAELVLVGDRDEQTRKGVAGIVEDRVFFRGELPYADVAKEMQLSSCLVLFSDIENAPCVIGEAFCCGLPVIATNVGGIPEMVNTSNGCLVEPRDEKALTAAMKQVMENYSRYDRSRISAEAAGRYSYEAVGAQMAALYQTLPGKRSAF